MIIWLNGTFGAGKTATAKALLPLVPDTRLFDPEMVGYMLRPHLTDHPVSDFQDLPPWRPLVVATAAELSRYTGQHLIAPQTIMTQPYFTEIAAGLHAARLTLFHVLLDARSWWRWVTGGRGGRPAGRSPGCGPPISRAGCGCTGRG
ncbi:MAG: hypothetical protein ACRDOB_09865 [Streptosporangiaceae bacterium]